MVVNPVVYAALQADFTGNAVSAYYLGFRFHQLNEDVEKLARSNRITNDALDAFAEQYYAICTETRKYNQRWKWIISSTYTITTIVFCFNVFTAFVVRMLLLPRVIMVAFLITHVSLILMAFLPPAYLSNKARAGVTSLQAIAAHANSGLHYSTRLKVRLCLSVADISINQTIPITVDLTPRETYRYSTHWLLVLILLSRHIGYD